MINNMAENCPTSLRIGEAMRVVEEGDLLTEVTTLPEGTRLPVVMFVCRGAAGGQGSLLTFRMVELPAGTRISDHRHLFVPREVADSFAQILAKHVCIPQEV